MPLQPDWRSKWRAKCEQNNTSCNHESFLASSRSRINSVNKLNNESCIKSTQALHGLAPKCKLINIHEMINKSTNDYVTLLPCKNGANVNNKG